MIKEAVAVVAVWRRLYTGVTRRDVEEDEKRYTVLIRYSLDDAANKVGIPKKTLDDYLHLLLMGRKFNFPFSSHGNEKIGQLRAFVNKAKAKARVNANKKVTHN